MTRSEIARTLSLALASLTSLAAVAQDSAAADAAKPPYTLTGHVDVVSRYVLRGVTSTYGNGAPLGNKGADAPESNRPALQWGVDWVHESGFYLGYFGSTINYSYKQLGKSYEDRGITDFQKDKSIENDFYGGYTFAVGDFTFNVGATGYVYINGEAANALESKLAATWGPVTLSAQTLFNDTVWGNRGDTYWALTFTKPLPYDFTFTASLGYYTYEKEGKYLGTTDTLAGTACGAGEAFVVNGCFAGKGPSSGGWRHLILGVSQPIGSTGFVWGAQAIFGGENRFGVDQGDRFVATLSYLF